MEQQISVLIPGTTQVASDQEAVKNHDGDDSTTIADAAPVNLVASTIPTALITPVNSSSTPPSTSLIDSYSIRRRSMISSNDATDGSIQVERSDGSSSNTLFEELSNTEIIEKLNGMRKRLARTIRDLPNESPKKKQNCTAEKTKLMDATRCLNGACKAMIEAACDGKIEKTTEIINEVIQCADKITSVTERLITKSDSIFEAELASAKTDQMLKSLQDTIICLDKAEECAGNIGSQTVNEMLAKNTALSANIAQLLETFYRRPS
ncbi:unnamed protein product [Enterobius vermicularis]|uniref:Talin_middle domain-containing protein n=1 Tax=Enterobius vermicularis TaxID=51028 RepID=A0A0N4VQ09_ENTVE|nr:unnamed protein product [Enterobius vermicularis]